MTILEARQILAAAGYRIDASKEETDRLNEAVHKVINYIDETYGGTDDENRTDV